MTKNIYAFIIGSIIAFILCASGIVIIGYVLNDPSLRNWQQSTEMALPTAICFFDTAIVLAYFAYRHFTDK